MDVSMNSPIRTPEYYLIKPLNVGDETFPSGTLVHPVWNKGYLTRERREEIEKDLEWFAKYNSGEPVKVRVWCLIGREWVMVDIDNIGMDKFR
jgi:hypothetical protein